MTYLLTVWRGERLILDRKPFPSLAEARDHERTYARDPRNLCFISEARHTVIFPATTHQVPESQTLDDTTRHRSDSYYGARVKRFRVRA